MLPWACFQAGPAAKPRSTSQVRKHAAMATEGFLHHQNSKTGSNPAADFKTTTQVVGKKNVLGTRYFFYLLSVLYMGQEKKSEIQGQISTLVWHL